MFEGTPHACGALGPARRLLRASLGGAQFFSQATGMGGGVGLLGSGDSLGEAGNCDVVGHDQLIPTGR